MDDRGCNLVYNWPGTCLRPRLGHDSPKQLKYKMFNREINTDIELISKLYVGLSKQARKLQAMLPVQNYGPLTDSLTGVRCRATGVAKNLFDEHS